ncbi:MAG: restriction endonuclease subunit S [Spirochaetaceae bacterium]|nr:restriction endonuclease subunit S [Spirochaetaceae bacterium]
MTDGLKDEHREAIIAAIAASDRVERAVLFGSRATGTNTVSSDVDIALFGGGLTLTDHARLAVALDEIPMAQEIDLVLYDSIQDETLKKNIRDQSVEWYSRPIQEAANRGASRHACTWPLMSLRQAGVSLIDCEHRTPPATDDGYPYVGIPQIRNGRLDLDSARLIAEEHYRAWTRRANPEPFDIVLSRRCNPGETGYVSPGLGKFAVGQNLVLLRSDGERVIKPFLRWLSRSPGWWAQVEKYVNAGAVFDSLKCADIPEFQLPIPTRSEQHTIAHILGTLDDKIELNRNMSATLDAMACALFNCWFVHFDPVRTKLEGRDTCVPEHVAALFPCKFVEAETGPVPKGWDVVSLSHIIDINPTRRLPKGQRAPYLDMANMPTTGHVPHGVIDKPFGSGMRFTNGDTLVARITPCLENGKTAYVDFLQPGAIGWGSTEYLVMRPKQPLPTQFAYCLARSAHFRAFLISNMSGTSGRQRVSAPALSQFMCINPPEGIAQAFEKIVQPVMRRASVAARESRRLSTIRDTLLPRLLGGELRINRFMEETA